ncbi:hypothetical protein UPYG_G00177780 [Umbra pygmaea]|uniref:Uncharacterized protein n=1 Tax=Umbra pygmaea TaxID=75934 RepID=A0ABD0X6V1_UMBPY
MLFVHRASEQQQASFYNCDLSISCRKVFFYDKDLYTYSVLTSPSATYADARAKLHQAEYSSDLTDTEGGSRKRKASAKLIQSQVSSQSESKVKETQRVHGKMLNALLKKQDGSVVEVPEGVVFPLKTQADVEALDEKLGDLSLMSAIRHLRRMH